VTHSRPVALGDGHDLPRLTDECVPGVTTVVDDVVEGFEDPIGEPILAHELPDILLAVEFGGARRQRQERDVSRNPEFLGAVPTGLIENENGVGARCDLGGDLVEMKLHGWLFAGRQHDRRRPPAQGRPLQTSRSIRCVDRVWRGDANLPSPSFNPATDSAVRLCIETTAQQARAGLDEFLTVSKETLGIFGRRLQLPVRPFLACRHRVRDRTGPHYLIGEI